MTTQDTPFGTIEDRDLIEPGPAVSWGAVIAGAIAAAAISFVLLAIGASFGLTILDPAATMQMSSETATAFGLSAAVFLLVVHGLSSGFGGYIAGRLRDKLTNLRHDETYFRDTAHGLLVWAVSAVVAVAFVTYLSAQAAQTGARLGAAGISAVGQGMGSAISATSQIDQDGSGRGLLGDTAGYFVDILFRPGPPAATGQAAEADEAAQAPAASESTPGEPATAPTMPLAPASRPGASAEADREEVARILRMSLADGQITADDKTYVAQLIAAETGLSQAEAERRIDEVIGKAMAAQERIVTTARETADAAVTAAQATAIWSAIAMLVGAFCACLAATWGGKARDLPGD